MIFLTVATFLVAVLTLLEAVDPGILSTALPVPLVWAALLASWLVHGARAGRENPAPTLVRIALTVGVALTTIAGAVLLTPGAPSALPAALAAGAAAAAAYWTLLEHAYADHPLRQDRP